MNSHPCHPKHSESMICSVCWSALACILIETWSNSNSSQKPLQKCTPKKTPKQNKPLAVKDILPLNSFVSQACFSSWAMENFHARFPPFPPFANWSKTLVAQLIVKPPWVDLLHSHYHLKIISNPYESPDFAWFCTWNIVKTLNRQTTLHHLKTVHLHWAKICFFHLARLCSSA